MSVSFQSNLDFLRFRWRPAMQDWPQARCEMASAVFDEICPELVSYHQNDIPIIVKEFFYTFRGFANILDYDSVPDEDGCIIRGYRWLSNYQHYDTGLFGIDSIMIMWDFDNWEKGVTVSIPSRGLWIIQDWFGFDTFYEFLSYLDERKVHFTRVDICFDDYDYREEGHLTAFDFVKWFVDGALVTRCKRKPSYHDSQVMIEGGRKSDHAGATFQLGSRSGDRLIRIYDKFYESRLKANVKHDESLFKDCVRYEFQINEAYAQNFVQALLLSRDSLTLKDYVDGWFDFKNVYAHKDGLVAVRNIESLPQWETFKNLEFSEDLHEEVNSPTTIQLWLRNKNNPTLESRIKYYDYACEEMFMRKIIMLDDPVGYFHDCMNRIRAGDVSERFKKDIIDHYHCDYKTAISISERLRWNKAITNLM